MGSCHRYQRRSMLKKVIQCLTLISIVILSLSHPSAALEASFTHAPDKDTGSTDGPLPLSQNQRNQLLQLDQQIAQSPNPQETLQKVAETNGMSTDELGDLLMRNRRDMEMANGGGGGAVGGVSNSLPRKMLRVLSTIFLIGLKKASAHPRSATIMALLFISTLYVLISAPRNGIILSSRNGILSSGHTTFLSPPTKYLSKYISRVPHKSSMHDSIKTGSLARLFSDEDAIVDDSIDGYYGVHIKKLSKSEKKKVKLIATARKEIPFAVLLPSEEELEMMHEKEASQLREGGLDEDTMQNIEDEAWEHAIDLAFSSACRILNKRRYSEFVASPSNRLRIYSEPRRDDHHKDVAALVMKSMGNWRRFGIQPLRVASESESENLSTVVYYTLKGGEFDGELKFSVSRNIDDEEEPSIIVSATLIIPSKGRKIKTKLASKMLSLLVESIAISSVTEAKQILSRELQSTIHRGRARTRALEKRHIAFENMKKMEEMAEERRRRWQRKNPGTSGYRPSGHMMRGPGGGPGRSF